MAKYECSKCKTQSTDTSYYQCHDCGKVFCWWDTTYIGSKDPSLLKIGIDAFFAERRCYRCYDKETRRGGVVDHIG